LSHNTATGIDLNRDSVALGCDLPSLVLMKEFFLEYVQPSDPVISALAIGMFSWYQCIAARENKY
jgi:hypothetical protein